MNPEYYADWVKEIINDMNKLDTMVNETQWKLAGITDTLNDLRDRLLKEVKEE